MLVLSETEKLKIFAEELCKERKDLLSIFSLSLKSMIVQYKIAIKRI